MASTKQLQKTTSIGHNTDQSHWTQDLFHLHILDGKLEDAV